MRILAAPAAAKRGNGARAETARDTHAVARMAVQAAGLEREAQTFATCVTADGPANPVPGSSESPPLLPGDPQRYLDNRLGPELPDIRHSVGTDALPKSADPPVSPPSLLPAAQRRYFERRLGQPLPDIRLRAGTAAQAEAAAAGARAFTRGAEITFGAGAYAPHVAAGQRLIAHEVAHVAQQSAGRAPRTMQRDPQPSPAPADAARDAEMVQVLQTLPDYNGAMFVDEAGGLLALERRFPQANAIILPRLVKQFGQQKMDDLRRYDTELMTMVHNSAIIAARIETLQAAIREGRQTVRG